MKHASFFNKLLNSQVVMCRTAQVSNALMVQIQVPASFLFSHLNILW